LTPHLLNFYVFDFYLASLHNEQQLRTAESERAQNINFTSM